MIKEKAKKAFLWYFLMKKRMLCRVGFILILLSVPLLTVLFSLAAKDGDTGFLRIALAAEDDGALAEQVIENFVEDSGIVYYQRVASPDEALEMVKAQKVDAAWVFRGDLESLVEEFARGNRQPLVTVYETDDTNMFLMVARERVYSSLYDRIAYYMYEDALQTLLPDVSLTDEELREAYDGNFMESDLIKFTFVNDKETDINEANYLLSPLRGLLSVIILLCGMAATMYYLADEKNGTFSFVSPHRRIYIFFGTNLCATSLAAAVVSAALIFSGLYTSFVYEGLVMLFYIFGVSAFCTVLGILASNLSVFAIMLPVVLVISMLMTPVFFNFSGYPALQNLLPTFHYLFAAHDHGRWWHMGVYAVSATAAAFVLYKLWWSVKLKTIALKK
ncbi:MAG: ABC transporter permease [Ruminococcaceae bacterium]|nr:ABC transporter permease [Oscillospiraceae bacterium]